MKEQVNAMEDLFEEARARHDLERRWLRLTQDDLPAVAKELGWPICEDHCFQRVLLDAACGACWYDKIPKRPAYRFAPDEVLMRAVDLAAAVLDGQEDMTALNRQSLGFRGKIQPSP